MDFKKVVLPLTPEAMVEHFSDKEQFYEIDVPETLTKMNERAMLSYISNLGMKCAFNYVSPVMMEEYMRMKNFVEAPMLTAIHANILCFMKYEDIPYPPGLEHFDKKTMITFIIDHEELVIEQAIFLDSFLLFAESRRKGFELSDSQPKDEKMHDELGFSLLKLLTYEDFMIVFSRRIPSLERQTYYTKYFDGYIFKGQNLFYYASKSPLFGMISVIDNEKKD